MATRALESPHSPPTARVGESSEYDQVVRGVDIEAVQIGRGSPTSVSTKASGRIVATSVLAGFPMMSSAVIHDDLIAATVVTRSAPGARWCGHPLAAGDVVIHGPETPHTATNPEGFGFAFAVLPVGDVLRAGGEMHSYADDLTGKFVKLAPTPAARRLGRAIASAFPQTPRHNVAGARSLAGLDAVVADAIGADARNGGWSTGRRISDSAIVRACIDHATAIGRRPTIAEMRLAAHVSERRLRSAFTQEVGVPPSTFFRHWAIDQARRSLINPKDGSTVTVGKVATDLGFGHLGRFAAYYHSQFAEWPSATLARSVGRDPFAGPR